MFKGFVLIYVVDEGSGATKAGFGDQSIFVTIIIVYWDGILDL